MSKDILNGRRVYYDYTTTNTSFLKVVKTLKDERINNYAFPLMIYDKSLIGIDPYGEEAYNNVSIQLKIANEVANNFWYFIREVLKIPNPGANFPFALHRGNLAMLFCLQANINTYVELPRQHYKTYSAVAYYCWVNMYKARNYNMIFTHKAHNDTIENLRRLKVLIDGENGCIPKYLLAPLGDRDKNNENELIIGSNNNRIKCISPANDAASADRAGRGSTVPLIWLDEIAFIKYNSIMYGSMMPAYSTAAAAAQSSGTPYSILLTTTPSSLDISEGKFVFEKIIGQSLNFDEKFYDYYFDNGLDWLQEFIKDNSLNFFVYVKFSYKQLGKDDIWLNEQLRKLNNDMVLVKRELLLEWTYSSDDSLLSEEKLDEISKYADVDYEAKVLINDRYHLYFTKMPSNMITKNYIMSLDIAGGLGRDKTALVITDPKDDSIVALLYSNTMQVTTLAEKVVPEIIDKYFPKAIVIPELNHTGTVFAELMLKQKKYEKNLFYVIKEYKAEKLIQENKDIFAKSKKQMVKKERRVYGITTTTKTRKIMTEDLLFNMVENRPELFNNRDIFAELKSLIRTKTGKIEHAPSSHDDILFAYLIGMYARLFEGKSMKRFLKNITDDEDLFNLSEEEINDRYKQRNNLSRIRRAVNKDLLSESFTSQLEESGTFDAKTTIEEEAIINRRKTIANKINKFRNLM